MEVQGAVEAVPVTVRAIPAVHAAVAVEVPAQEYQQHRFSVATTDPIMIAVADYTVIIPTTKTLVRKVPGVTEL